MARRNLAPRQGRHSEAWTRPCVVALSRDPRAEALLFAASSLARSLLMARHALDNDVAKVE